MNTIIDLNQTANVTVNQQSSYSIAFGTNAGNISINTDAFDTHALAKQTPLNSVSNAVRDILIDVQFPSYPSAGSVAYTGPYGNIGVQRINNTTWRIFGVRDVNRYNEAFANVRVADTGVSNAYSYTTLVQDQYGNNRSWSTAVNVRALPVLSSGNVLYRENATVDITQLSISANANSTANYVLSSSVSTGLGQVSNIVATTSNVSITGNISTLTSAIAAGDLRFVSAAGLTSNVAGAVNFKLSLNNNLVSQANANITYVPTVYNTNTVTQIFSTTTPRLTDGADTGQTYTVTFTSPNGKFGNSVAYFDSNTYANLSNIYTFTGNMSTVNANFANIRFAPAVRNSGNTTYTYTQSRGNVAQITSLRSLTANAVPFAAGNTYTITSTGTFTPSFEQAQYGQTQVLLVGGGGAAQYGETRRGPAGANIIFPGGSGGGGEVRYVSNVALIKSEYTATVGTGGVTGNTNLSTAGNWPSPSFQPKEILYKGTDGGYTQLSGGNITITAQGGLAGTWDIESLNPAFFTPLRWSDGQSFGGNGGGNLSVGNITGGQGGWSSTQLNGNAGVTSGNSSNGSTGGGGGGFGVSSTNTGGNGGTGVTHPLTGNLVLGGGGASRSGTGGSDLGVNGGNSYGLGGSYIDTTGANGVIIINIA